uniref:Uncharacterized protein n=1 Tax=Ixodes ricinus TaxID=34613 RepID=A0A147BTD8_IXORI
MGLFFHIHMGVFMCTCGTILSHPYGNFYVHLWEYSFTSIWEFLRAFMRLFFHIHMGVFRCTCGTILSHPYGSFYVHLWDYSFTFIWELLRGPTGVFFHILLGVMCTYASIPLHPPRSFNSDF